MHLRRLALSNKIVLLVALGAVLGVLGQWVIEQASPASDFGWVAYAPLTASSGVGLHPWVQAVLWLLLILVWTVAALLLLREPKPRPAEIQDNDAIDGSR